MSFHWNLSSDEEEETHEWQSKLDALSTTEDTKLPAQSTTPVADETITTSVDCAVASKKSLGDAEEFDFSEEEEDDVDWQDADDEDSLPDFKLAAATSTSIVPVTIDMNQPSQPPEKKKKKKRTVRRQVYRYHSLSPDLQWLLLSIQQSHLLTLTSRAVQLSQCCSDWELLHVVHSLVPLADRSLETPTESEVQEFVSWYFDLVNRARERRRRTLAANIAAGAPTARRGRRQLTSTKTSHVNGLGVTKPERLFRVSSYLSRVNDEHPQLVANDDTIELTNQDKAQFLVSMVRSIGWRARYVMALDPIRCDLDADHPLFQSSVGNLFRALSNRPNGDRNKKKPFQKINEQTSPCDSDDAIPSTGGKELGWVEILCRPPSSRKATTSELKPSKFRWVHVDPGHELVDQPGAVETLFETMNQDCMGARKRKRTIAYALSVEHVLTHNATSVSISEEDERNQLRLTDVTPRYANSWCQSLQARSVKTQRNAPMCDNAWWTESLKQINSFHHNLANEYFQSRSRAALQARGASQSEAIQIADSSDEDNRTIECGSLHQNGNDAIELDEKAELLGSAANETIPTSKAAFCNHPIYVIKSVLNANEVLAPDAKSRMCGIFKGEPVYRRNDVHTALVAKKWLYQGRKVKNGAIGTPVKRVKARKKAAPKGFQPLQSYGVGDGNDGSDKARERDIALGSKPEEEDDGMNDLYAFWQTMPWSPAPVGPSDPIPVNEYNNVELELLNPGLEHLEEPRMSQVAKKLGIPYAPCLLGFEGHGGNRTPTIRGIVVHEHNTDILREAHAEFMSQLLKQEREETGRRVNIRWKRLMVGLLTKERLEREYGDDQDGEED